MKKTIRRTKMIKKTERNKIVQDLLDKLEEQLSAGYYYFYFYPDGNVTFVKKDYPKKEYEKYGVTFSFVECKLHIDPNRISDDFKNALIYKILNLINDNNTISPIQNQLRL